MPSISEIRAQYPQYSDMSDAALADALHKKFYSDMPRDDFDKKIGVSSPQEESLLSQLAKPITDIPGEVYSAAKSAASTIADQLNPFSDARHAAIERQANAPSFLAGLSEGVKSVADTGKGILAVPELASAPITGTARSALGHPFAAVSGVPYEEAKGAVDTAMMGLAPKGFSPAGARLSAPPLPTAKDLKLEARAAYQSPEVKGLKVDPYATDLLASKIEMDLRAKGFRPSSASASSTFDSVSELRSPSAARAVSVDDIDNARKALGITAKQRDAMGQPTPDATAASAAIRQIDDYLANISPVDVIAGNPKAAQAKLAEARANYAAGKRAGEIDFRLDKAERQAARSGSGMNIENARRQKIDQVSDYGLTPEEIAIKDKIVLGTPTRNTLRTFGKLGVDGGLSLLLNAGAAVGSGGATIPVTAAATTARILGEILTKRQISQLNDAIRARSPLAQARVPTPLPPPPSLFGALYPNIAASGLEALSGLPQARKEGR